MGNKCTTFLEFFDNLVQSSGVTVPDEVQEFYDMLKDSQGTTSDKPVFTETGLVILKYMQQCDSKTMKAKDIAEGVLLSSRKVSGAMRKLVNDGYVEKFGTNPVNYSITNQGKEIDLTIYKENLNNEED
ncbi:MAG: winged helix-turn-helix transcriptional regulator [Acetobacter sp.]|nr:winged helix-turn-helix transcriptional regulator [Acetobacter sp.]